MVEKKIIEQQIEMRLQKDGLLRGADKQLAEYAQKQKKQTEKLKANEQTASSSSDFNGKKQHPFVKDNKVPSTKGVEDKKTEENAVAFTYYLGVVLQKAADLFYENLQLLKQLAQSCDDKDLKPLVIADLIQSIGPEEKKIPVSEKVFTSLREKLEAEFSRLLVEYQEVLKKCIKAKAAVVKKCGEIQQGITNTLDQNGVSLTGVNTPYTQNPQQWIIDLLAPQPPKQTRVEAIKRDIVPSSVVNSDTLRTRIAETVDEKINDKALIELIKTFDLLVKRLVEKQNQIMGLGNSRFKEYVEGLPDISSIQLTSGLTRF